MDLKIIFLVVIFVSCGSCCQANRQKSFSPRLLETTTTIDPLDIQWNMTKIAQKADARKIRVGFGILLGFGLAFMFAVGGYIVYVDHVQPYFLAVKYAPIKDSDDEDDDDSFGVPNIFPNHAQSQV